MDMSTAFDFLNKDILMTILRSNGFPERTIAIYKDFLSGRRAVVQVGETTSEPFDLILQTNSWSSTFNAVDVLQLVSFNSLLDTF